jgi:hypothetical protein
MNAALDIMTWYEALSLIISVFGFGGIVYSIRQNTKQAKASVFFEFTKRYAEIDKDTNYVSSNYRKNKISKTDLDNYYKFLDQYIDLFHQEFELHRRRLIDNEIWKIWESYAREHVTHQTFSGYWESEHGESSFSPNPLFVNFINGLKK